MLLSQLNLILLTFPLHPLSVALNVNHTVNPLYAFLLFTVTPPFALIVPVGPLLSIQLTVALQLALFHTLSVNVTLCVVLLVKLFVCGLLVCNPTVASLAGILALTLPLVQLLGVYVTVQHTGAVRSIITCTLALLHQFQYPSLYCTYIVFVQSAVLHPFVVPNVQLLLVA